MISSRNVLRHELIGLGVSVMYASNPTHIGVHGIVVNETRNMLAILQGHRVKWVPKQASIFRLTLPEGGLVDVRGTALIMAPERRVNLYKKIRG